MANTHTEHHLAAQDPEMEMVVLAMAEAMTHLMGLSAPNRDFYLFPNPDMSAAVAVVAAAPIVMEILVLQEPEKDTVETEVAALETLLKMKASRGSTDTVVAAVVAVLI